MAIIIVSGGGHGDEMFRHFRPLYKGTLTANANVNRERGNSQRFTEDGPLAEVERGTPRHQVAIPIPPHTNHHNQQGADYARDNT